MKETPHFHLTTHARKRLEQRFPDVTVEQLLSALGRSIFVHHYKEGNRVLTVYATILMGGRRALALADQEGNIITVGPAEMEGYAELNPDWSVLTRVGDGRLHHPDLFRYEQLYANLPCEPLKITCIAHNVAGQDPINIDSLLAYEVVREATDGAMLPDMYHSCWALPIPVQIVWQTEGNLPFYACSQMLCVDSEEVRPLLEEIGSCFLEPVGARTEPKEVRLSYKSIEAGSLALKHERNRSLKNGQLPSGRNLWTHSGIYRPQRSPVTVHLGCRFEAYVIGNYDEIKRLLTRLQFIGKHRARGYGHVQEWHVERISADLKTIYVDEKNRLRRYFPVAALSLLGPDVKIEGTPVWYGASPPYYIPAVQMPCWPVGSKVLWNGKQEEAPSAETDKEKTRHLLDDLKGRLARLRPSR